MWRASEQNNGQKPRRVWGSLGMLLTASVALTAGLLGPSAATAAPLDIRFEKFYDASAPATSQIKNDAIKSLMREIGLAIGPRSLGPIASQGALGVDAGYEISMSGANSNADYWKRGVATPSDSLVSHSFHVRKGWPQSLQLGTSVTHLADSNLYAAGVEVQMSLIDGFRYIPDFGVRASASAVLGNSRMDFVQGAADVAMSKSLGVAGVASIQPWLGYSYGLGYYKPNLDALFPNDQTLRPITPKFESGFLLSHRAAAGVRVVVARMQFGFEVLRSFTDSLNLMTGKIGVVF